MILKKWNRTDYCERTIAKAIEFVSQNQEAYYRDNVFNSDVFDADVSDTSDAINKNVNKEWAEKLTEENFLNRETFERIFRIQDKIERAEIITLIYSKAKEFNRVKDFSRLFKAHQEEVEKQLKKGGNFMNFPQPPLSGLNCGAWHCEPDGVYRMCVKENEPRMVFACRHPILPTKRLISAYGSEKIEISFFRDGKWQSFIVSRLQISSSAKIVELANRGIDVTTESSKELIKFLTDMIMNNLDKIPVCESISRLGWVKEDFIPYVNHIAFDGDPNYQNLFDDVQKSGDYSIWKEHCLKIRKNIFLRLMMAASFASPLIEKLGLSPFVFHLWGESGCGKTVGLCVAMSIWGNPAPGHLTRTLNMTKTAMAKNAAFLYSIPFAGDELQIVKNQFNYDLNNLIMYLSEGIDRGRANSSGGLDRLLTWNNTFLFTGEEPITKSNSGGGTNNRVIEVEVKGSVVERGFTVSVPSNS